MDIPNKNRGATLVISLVMLLMLTLISVASMQTTAFEDKMATNMSDLEYAFQSTEAALREGEAWLDNLAVEPEQESTCSTKPCVLLPDPLRYPEDFGLTWWQTIGTAYNGPTLNAVPTSPIYLIEYSRFVPDTLVSGQNTSAGIFYYRVVARGTGRSDDAVVILESTYGRRF